MVRAALSVSLLSLMVAGCAVDRIRGDADQLAAQGDYEHAVQALEAGVAEYPDSAQLRGRLMLLRTQALAQLLAQARAAEAAGDPDQAEKLLRRAQPFDTSGQRVAALLDDLAVARRQDAALAQANALAAKGQVDAALKIVQDALKDNRHHAGLLALQHRLAVDQRQAQVRAMQQGLAETRPVTLDFRDANIRTVLDVVSRNSGVNFVLDKDVHDQHVTVYAKSVRFEDGLDMILDASQLAHKVLDARTVLIYPNTPEKQREHQEQVVKVFYLANGDAKGAAAFLKSAMKLRDPYVDDHHHLLMLRDSLENIQLAERLITLFDNPDPEVLLDAEVLEVSADRLTDLGVAPPSSLTLTPTTAATSGLTLASFPLHRGDIGIGTPSVTINANHTEGDVDTLANPKIRTRSGEKAKILIGDKIPIITSTTTPGASGFVSESVSYQDVGIKLEVEPEVFPDDDVAIKLNVEVSALGTETKTASGTIAYQISTRNASTLLRLHDGETQLLAGLISSDERSSVAGLPGLADIPLLGRLFSDQSHSRTKTEVVLAITPHVVRSQPHLDAAEAEAWVGTEAYQRLKPVGGRFDAEANAPSTASPTSTTPAAPVAPVAPAPLTGPLPPRSATPPSLPAANAATAPGAAAVGAHLEAVAPGTPAAITWTAPPSVKAGEVFDVQLQLRTGVPLGSLGLSVRYSSDVLGLVGFASASASGSDLPDAASQGTPAAHQEPNNVGVVDVQRLVPNASATPLSLVRLQFKALKDGDATVDVKAAPADASVSVAAPAALALKVGS